MYTNPDLYIYIYIYIYIGWDGIFETFKLELYIEMSGHTKSDQNNKKNKSLVLL